MQIVKFQYSGSATRKLLVMGRDQVIISGDDNSTQFIFNFPESYQNYSKEIVWDGFYIPTVTGEEYVARYPIINDTFYVPQEITLPNSGKEISFQVVMTKSQVEGDEDSFQIVESTQLFPIYISKSARGEQSDIHVDSLSQLVEKAYVKSAYDIDQEQDRPIITFSSLLGNSFNLILNMPYLNEETGKIAESFMPPGSSVKVVTFENVDQMIQDETCVPPDFAIISDGTTGEIDYPGNIFIKTNEETDYNGWVLIHSQYVDDNIDNKVDKIQGYSLVEDTEIQKLATVEEGAQVNVQADWEEADTTQDSYIQNKPILGTAQFENIGITQGTIPVLNQNGKLPNTVIPPLAIGDYIDWPQGMAHTVQNLVYLSDAEKGDITTVDGETDASGLNGIYFLNGVYNIQQDWIQIVGPSNVISVNGDTGVVVIGLQDLNGISQSELDSIDSGITSQLVTQISTNESNIQTINQSDQMNSGITANKVQAYDGYAQQIQSKMALIQNPQGDKLITSTVSGEVQESDALTSKLQSIQSGAQVNVIEVVKVNDTALTVTDKAVNVDLSGYVVQQTLENYQQLVDKNQANGYAGLDSNSKVDILNIPTGAIQNNANNVVPTSGAVYNQLSNKQDSITAERGLSFNASAGYHNNLGHSNQEITPETVGVGGVSVSGATDVLTIKYDQFGHIADTITTTTVYPPTSGATAGYVWTSNGIDQIGQWVQPSLYLDATSTTTIPSEKAVGDAIDLAVENAYIFKGAYVTLQALNADVQSHQLVPKVGWVYTITSQTNPPETDVHGNEIKSGDKVTCTQYVVTPGTPDTYSATWEIFGGVPDMSAYVTINGAQTVDGKTFTNVVSINSYVPAQAMAKGVDISSGSLNTTDDSTVPTSKLVAQSIGGKMDELPSIPQQGGQLVVTVQNDSNTLAYMTSNVGVDGKTLIDVYNGVISQSSATEGGVDTPVYLNGGALTHIGDGINSIGSSNTPVYVTQNGVISPILTIDQNLLPTGMAHVHTATITGDGTTTSWTFPVSGGSTVFRDPASVSIRDSSGNEVQMDVQYTTVNSVNYVIISTASPIANDVSFSVKIIA